MSIAHRATARAPALAGFGPAAAVAGLPEPGAARASAQQLGEPPRARGRLFGAQDPVRDELAVARRTRLEVAPCRLVHLEHAKIRRLEFGPARLLVRIEHRPSFGASRERRRAGRLLAPRGAQRCHLGDVDRALQIEPIRRGVKRIWYECSSILFLTPSIQPTHSASSTDSDQLMLGLPESTLEADQKLGVPACVRREPVAERGRACEERRVRQQTPEHDAERTPSRAIDRARSSDDRPMYDVIRLHAAAPDKPALGQPCNGCGVCCASEPCPVGMVVSLRTTGACDALVWNDADRRYRCGLIEQPSRFLPRAWHWTAPWLARVARRYISAGSGCDCSAQVERLRGEVSPST